MFSIRNVFLRNSYNSFGPIERLARRRSVFNKTLSIINYRHDYFSLFHFRDAICFTRIRHVVSYCSLKFTTSQDRTNFFGFKTKKKKWQ